MKKTTKQHIEEYQQRQARVRAMGGPEAVQKRQKEGQWTARERIDYLFDPGTFNEIGLFVEHRTVHFGMDKREIPAEGVITGHGLVNGRPVVAFADDFTSMAGTFGEAHGAKLVQAVNLAEKMGCPLVGMNDSGGARLQEGMDTLEAYGRLFRAQIMASGVIPQIAILMGPCLGGQAFHPVMQDFLIQCKETGLLSIAGPAFVKTQTGEEISLEELSGWKVHAVKSGQTHLVVKDDREAIDRCKELLALLPSSNREKPPRVRCGDDPERLCPELDTIVPDRSTQPYDMYRVIRAIADNGYFFETMGLYARNAITGFARFNGRTVGIWANQPMWASGTIDVNAADKGARFARFCDLFNIPIVALGDCPGVMIGSEQDWKGVLRHGAKLLYAWVEATVPLISVILRKSYACGHYGMLDKGIGADMVFAWPSARVSIVGAETAASVIFAREIKEAKDPQEIRAKRIAEFEGIYENPYFAAARGCVDDIIMPRDTRKAVNQALDLLENKSVDSSARPKRKGANINL